MSISDGLCPSIFRRNTEKKRSMRDEMDGKVVYFPPESAFELLMLYFVRVLFPIFTLTWRADNYVSRQGKGLNRKNEKTKDKLGSTDDINHSNFVFLTIFTVTVFKLISFIKKSSVFTAVSYFPVENGNHEK